MSKMGSWDLCGWIGGISRTGVCSCGEQEEGAAAVGRRSWVAMRVGYGWRGRWGSSETYSACRFGTALLIINDHENLKRRCVRGITRSFLFS